MKNEESQDKVNDIMVQFVKEQLMFNKLYKQLKVEDQINVLEEFNYQIKIINDEIENILDKSESGDKYEN